MKNVRVFFSVWSFEKYSFLDLTFFGVTKKVHFLAFLTEVIKKC